MAQVKYYDTGSGQWIAAANGGPGSQGIQGTQGLTGTQGTQGLQGTQGATGTSALTTKGDLLAYDTAPNRLPVGADGSTLVANSASAIGVAWAGPSVAAGKNLLINGDMSVAQRGIGR
jgi:hypothetical protein